MVLHNVTASLFPPSSLSSKLEHLTALQRHLEGSLKKQPSDTGANISEGDRHYTNYYFMGGEEEETTSDTEQPVSSTPKKTSPRRNLSSDLAATTAALRDATAQVGWWVGGFHGLSIFRVASNFEEKYFKPPHPLSLEVHVFAILEVKTSIC